LIDSDAVDRVDNDCSETNATHQSLQPPGANHGNHFERHTEAPGAQAARTETTCTEAARTAAAAAACTDDDDWEQEGLDDGDAAVTCTHDTDREQNSLDADADAARTDAARLAAG